MKADPSRELIDSEPYTYRKEIQIELARSLTSIVNGMDCRVIIRTVSRLLRLNLLECSLLSWLLSHGCSLQWLIQHTRPVTIFTRKKEQALFLLLLLNGYYVKAFLSRSTANLLVDADVLAAAPHFPSLYQSWQPAAKLDTLSLTELNQRFEKQAEGQISRQRDYNSMVSSILELSKTYNIGGNRQKPNQESSSRNDQPEKDLLNQLDQYIPHQESQFARREEEDDICILRVSSGRYRRNESNAMDISEGRNIFDSRNNPSQPSLFGSGQRNRGIKPTYSFFDDI